ncbi:MAG: PAS domain S-box protein [Verrucomicrobia bacterium]|nr:PAS domain S-box protein [Verrucomicrobiota bacterium]MCH8512253.1 PAS domain S-box protein [Kiritimatiellia bacterium]
MKNPDRGERKPPKRKQNTAKKTPPSAAVQELRLRAESRLQKGEKSPEEIEALTSDTDTRRLLHELQVHQIELEMQNVELQESRNHAESLRDKYIELYDFSPVGYFSLDEKGLILEVNLTGAAMLGVVRSELIGSNLTRFAESSCQSVLFNLLASVFADSGKKTDEIQLKKHGGEHFWAGLYASPAFSTDHGQKVCRMAISDVTAHKKAEEARHQVELLTHSNQELKQEIVRRQAVEEALKKSERHQKELLEQARDLQGKLRKLSHSNLHAVERERKRISRDLHDDVIQTLVGINFHLAALAEMPEITAEMLKEKIVQTQHLVEASVRSILTYALELRPPGLDDLGLVVSLNTFLKDFMKRTGIEVDFKANADEDQLGSDQRIALYRIVQTGLANVMEHAEASRVELRISETADEVSLQITDNGISFDVPGHAALRSGKHLGLISMRERAEMMGGTFRIESQPGQGTSLYVRIPITGNTGGTGGTGEEDPAEK